MNISTPINLIDSLAFAAKDRSRGIYLITSPEDEVFISYHELYAKAEKALAFLQSKGLSKGSALLFQINEEQDFLVAFWACIMGGITPVPLTLAKTDAQISKFYKVIDTVDDPYVIGDLTYLDQLFNNEYVNHSKDIKLIPVQELHDQNVQGDKVEVTKDDIAFIQFSSGSTGKPKGVVLTHGNLIANMQGISQAGKYADNDRLLSWMPLTHDMGMIGFHLNPIYSGIDQFIISTSAFIRKPSLWLEKASEHRITVTSSPNFGYKYLMLRTDLSQCKWDLSSIRVIYNGAEPISLSICTEFLSKMKEFGLSEKAMVPVYGLAEASVAVSMTDLDAEVESLKVDRDCLSVNDEITTVPEYRDGVSFVNVGTSVPNCEVRIGDSEREALGEGFIGSILIKGDNVCKTYYNNASAHHEIMNEGWLDTGDLGFIKDGKLYITGRAKDILFVDGQNYFAHDIEQEMEILEEVELNRFVVTGYFDSDIEKERILAFVHHKGSLDSFVTLAEKVQRTVKQKFGFEFSHVIPVKQIPKTTSGKLQRFELLKAYQRGEFQGSVEEIDQLMNTRMSQTLELVGSDLEKVRSLWSRVLRVTDLKITDHFSAIGGNSIEAGEICNLIEQHWDVRLTLEHFYSLSTIEVIAANLDQLPRQIVDPVKASERLEVYDLSDAQLSLYYNWKTYTDSVAYNVPVVLEADHVLDPESVKAYFDILVERHEALSLRFRGEDKPKTYFATVPAFEWKHITAENEEIEQLLSSLVLPFDLEKGPLMRVHLIEKINSSMLFLDFHHIIADGQSIHLLLSEFISLYQGKTLPPKKIDFADYLIWSENEKHDSIEKDMNYWSGELSGDMPILELPTDQERPSALTFSGKRYECGFDGDTSKAIKTFCQQEGIMEHNFLLSCYFLLLSKYTLQSEIIMGIPYHGRSHQDLKDIFGMFVNSLPIRIMTDPTDTFEKLLQLVTDKVVKAAGHGELHYFNMLKLADQVMTPDRNPLFDTMFLYRAGLSGEEFNTAGFSKYNFNASQSKFDLTLDLEQRNGLLQFAFEYAESLFDRETIQRLANSFEKIVKEVIANPTQKLVDISVISEEDNSQIQGISQGQIRPEEDFQPVHQLFFERAANTPQAVCIEEGKKHFTYQEIANSVYTLTSYLKGHTQQGEVVAVMLPRSAELITALLGVMNTGRVFLPIDLDMNDHRRKELLQQSKARVLISNEKALSALSWSTMNFKVVTLDEINTSEAKPITVTSGINDLCYLMFTSGSTGRPKGVMITHGNLFNYITWANENYFEGDQLSVPLYSSISFDLTITSIFAPLINGGKILVYEKTQKDEVLIERVFQDNLVDLVKMTPAHLKLLLDNKTLSPATRVKKYILGGETLPSELARQLVTATSSNVFIYNEYGPTEATVGCITYQYDDNDTYKQVPIGLPIQNVNSYILDSNLKQVPFNVPGELYLSGKSLSKGYFEQPDLTADRFLDNPYVIGDTIYKTGDVAELTPEGYINYIGRNDRQVKINGYRVELGEVEAKINEYEGIDDAVVIYVKDPYARLIAYCRISPGVSFKDMNLMQRMMADLPHYMVPESIVEIDSMPLTSNGKVDTNALLKLNRERPENHQEASLEVTNILVDAWRKFFEDTQIDIHSNFYELGGDSIKAVQLSARLKEAGVEVTSREILTNSSILAMSACCTLSDAPSKVTDTKGHLAPTPIMSWFLDQGHANPNFYNQSVLLELKLAEADQALLNKAWTALIDKHPTMRLNFDEEQSSFYYNETHLTSEELISCYAVNNEKELTELCESLKGSFDIRSSLLIKPAIVHCQGISYFFITAHHLIVDAVSWRIILDDLKENLIALLNGRDLTTKPTGVSLKEWSEHLTLLAKDKTYQKDQLSYWEPLAERSSDQASRLPKEQLRVSNQEMYHFELDEETTSSLQEEARQMFNCDLDVLLNAALVEVLCQRADISQLVIEQENHGRHSQSFNLGNTVGWFTSLYPALFEHHMEMDTLIGSVKEQLQNVPGHGLGYGMMTASGMLKSNGKVGVRLNYLGELGSEFDNQFFKFRSDIPTGKEQDDRNTMSAELEMNAMVTKQKLCMEIHFNRHAYTAETIRDIGSGTLQFLYDALNLMQSANGPQYTPSDFSANIDQYELDMLLSED